MRKKAKVRRNRKIKNRDLHPKSSIGDFGMNRILSRIDSAIELLSRRR
jgi:hypothetical protein